MFRIFTISIFFTTIVINLSGQKFRFMDLPLKDICYSQVNDRLYGVLPGNSAQGNAFVIINPNTGAIEKRVEVGSEPSHISISNSGRTLSIALFGAPYLQRFDLSTNQFLPVTNLEVKESSHIPLTMLDMALLPNSETSLVVTRMYRGKVPRVYDMVVFDNSQLREKSLSFSPHGNKLLMMEDGQTLWGLGHDYFPTSLKRYRVSAQGVEEVASYPNLIHLEVTHVAYQHGRIYLQNGQIFDVSGSGAPQLLATLDIGQNYNKTSAPQVPAMDSNYIYFTSDLHRDGVANRYGGSFLKRVDKTTFQRVDSVAIPAPGWLWNGESTKKILSLGRGRIALLSEFDGHTRLMLYNSSPCTASQFNLKITPNSDLSVCFGDSIELSATPGFTDYYWSNGASGQKIKFSNKWSAKDTIRYRVIGANGCLSEPSTPVIVTFSTKPSELQLFTAESNRDALCPNEKAELRALSDRAAYSFVWSTGDTLPVGQNLKIDSGGIYTVWARGLYGCLSEPKSIEILEANPGARVKPVITKNGPLVYCNNNPSEFSGPANASAYEWSNGATTQSLRPFASGEYALRLSYTNGCKGPWSDTLMVKVGYQSPDQLRLFQQSDQLRIENSFFIADSIQWFFNDTLVPNPNRNYYFPQKKGFYSVVSYWQGCPSEPTIPYLYPTAIQASILAVSNNEQLTSYFLFPSINPIDNYRFKWSDGSTTPSLEVKALGTYCLTAYRDWSQDSATACITFGSLGDLQIEAIDNIPLPGVPVVLYKYLNPKFQVIDTVISDISGKALFENLENGTYYALALPTAGTPLAKQYLPTYARSAILWRDANPFQMRGFHPGTGFPERQHIFLERTQMLMGEGRITGFIRAAEGFAPSGSQGFDAANAQNEGLPNVSIILYDSTGKVVAITHSDANGNYVFENVPFGVYTVVINFLGVVPFSQVVNITTDEPQANKISFLLKNGNFVVVRTKEIPTLDLIVWPNPFSGNFYYTIPEKCQLFVYDVMGRLLAQRSYSEGVKEDNTLISQPTGVYWLKIQTESGKIGIKRLIKQ